MKLVFTIQIKSGYSTKIIKVEHIPINERTEHFKLILDGKPITLESNRPFFRNRGLKHRRPDWKIVEGKLDYQSSIDPVKSAIMEYLEPKK